MEFRNAERGRLVPQVGGLIFGLIATSFVLAQASADPLPRTHAEGRRLAFDFPGMKVGIAEYDEGPTGTTVFYFPDSAKGAVDVRGGAPGDVNAAVLMNARDAKLVQAVVFSGGSWYGLSAATGVANGIKDLKAEQGDPDFIAGVVGAIIFDVGGRRFSRVTPDDLLGKAALQSAAEGWFPLGARGAGRSAMQGRYFVRGVSADDSANWPHSGQGGAFRTIGPTKVAVFTVVNALGTIVDRDGRVVRCERNGHEKKCPMIKDQFKAFAPIGGSADSPPTGPTGNTTLTLVVTNQKLPFWALQRLAVQVHGSMNRGIQPFATEADGDVLFAVSTDEIDNPDLSPMDLGVLASELAWDAILSSVPDVPPAPALQRVQPDGEALRRFNGSYDFDGGGVLTIAYEEGALRASFQGNGRMFFDKDRTYRLAAAENGQFVIDAPASDVIRFEESEGRISGLTMNPGPWPIRATRRDQSN
ncbi:MAG: P1 family peptidase [Rhodanobacteraceae bacterium]|nr:P1 family peptidase [Rhodanobacteraceae bacterium]